MLRNEQIVIRCTHDGRGYVMWTGPVGIDIDSNNLPEAGLQGGVNFTKYTSAATLGTAVQNALPTLVP